MRKIAGLVLALLFASLLASAQLPGVPHPSKGMNRWWANPLVVNQLGLSDAQIKQLDQLAVDTAMTLIDEKAALEKQQVQLMALLIPDKLDEARFNQQVDATLAAETRLKKSFVGALLQGYNLLAPEQQKKLKTLLQSLEFMKRMQAGMGAAPGGRGPQPARPAPAPKPPE